MFTDIHEKEINKTLESIANQLDISPSKHEQAVSRYKSVSEWLDADNSKLKQYCPKIFPQDSFRIELLFVR